MKHLSPSPELNTWEETTFVWSIPNWSQLKHEKEYSDEFQCAGANWKVLLFPRGNKTPDTVSAFLECVDASTVQEPGWHRCAVFAIALAHPDNHSAHHRFTSSDVDWGFSSIMRQSQMSVPEGDNPPILENDAVDLIVEIRVVHDESGVLWHNFANWDSKKETGYVGLVNQGATCYLNSLLQSLYFTNYFRKATFQIPTEFDELSKSVALGLQRLFYNMQFSDQAIGTHELTKSFGWDNMEAFYQHDVQELNRVLQDNLEEKMKGTKAEGAIRSLFTGKMKSFIKCLNVDYESSRIEDFYDIQLNVKGCKNLHDSFVEYCAVETLDGDNKYFAEGHGLQDARKGCTFLQFPKVLHLQMKRFEYDMERDALVKINDRHEFPDVIELDQFLEEGADRPAPERYHLHGVLVHSGELHAGHYWAIIRPQIDGKWFKFDDDRVIPVSHKEVFDDNFGGEASAGLSGRAKRLTNAYMLVYVRECDRDDVLAPIEHEDIPEHLRRLFDEDRIAHDRLVKERSEQHLYMTVTVLTDEVIKTHPGFDLANFENKMWPITQISLFNKVARTTLVGEFKKNLAEAMHVSPKQLTLWPLVGRSNKTIRPDGAMSDSLDGVEMEVFRTKHLKTSSNEIRFYAEVHPVTESPGFLSNVFKRDEPKGNSILLFLKYYDPLKGAIEYVGNISKTIDTKIGDLVPTLVKLKPELEGSTILMFEEVKPGMVDLLPDWRMSLKHAELSDGDIICFQRELSPAEEQTLSDPTLVTVPGYFDAILSQIKVFFKPKQMAKTHKGEFTLGLSKKMKYDAVTQKVGEFLQCDPMYIRLTANSGAMPIKRLPTLSLLEMLMQPLSTPTGTFQYEILDVPITELDTKRYFKVTLLDRSVQEIETVEFLIPKDGTTSDVLHALTQTGKTEKAPYRLYEVLRSNIVRILTDEDDISRFNDYYHGTIYAEPAPEDELDMLPNDKLVKVVHYHRDRTRCHGIPLFFVIHGGEIYSATKNRLRSRLGMNEKEFGKVKVCYLPIALTETRELEDGDILSDFEFSGIEMVGLDHIDKKGGRPLAPTEKAIKIFN